MAQPERWTLRQKIIGVLLRQARLEVGKTLKECGQVLGFSSGVVSAIEYGKRAISLPELELLAYYLSVPMDYFLKDGDAPAGPSPEELPGEEVLALRHRIIAASLHQARSERGLSQKELAEMTELSKRRLSRYEQGQTPIPLVELEALAEALDVPLARFLDEGIGPVGEHQQREREWRQFTELPSDVRAFVLEPVNLSYLRMAMHLSQVPADGLRNIAASLLDITL